VGKHVIRRRELLKLSAAAGGAALLAACAPELAAPSGAPAASPSGRTSAGRFPLGKLEGPVIVTDAAKFPKTFKEAPELAALVQQGKLPPLAERLGQDPLVVQPAHSIGKYGGTLQKVLMNGAMDASIARFLPGPTSLLFWDVEWKTIVPNIARAFEVSADQKVITVQLRRGMRWSDGHALTADDILFWFEDILNDDSVHPGDSTDLLVRGKRVMIEKVDATTVRFVSPEANAQLLEIMASPLSDLGHSFRHELGRGGPYAPKHYLQQFHAKYVGEAQANRLATEAKFPSWQAYIKAQFNHRSNPALPVIYPWIVKVPATNPTSMVLERNPYSIWVDTAGNQLPYIGSVNYTVVANPEVLALKTTNGEVDLQEAHYTPAQLAVLVQNEQRGGYKTYLDPSQSGVGIALNLAYDEDPLIGELIRNVDFRRALSFGIDREQLNETFFSGTGIPSSAAPASENKYYPGDEWRTKWSTLDVAQANQLLDKIGLTQKDGEGYRLRSDGKRLTLTFLAPPLLLDQASAAERVKQHWRRIGIDLGIEAVAANLATQRVNANQAQMVFNSVGTDDVYLAEGFQTPTGGGFSAIMGIPYGQWIRSAGKQGKEPFAALKQAAELLDRGKLATSADERISIGKELTRLAVDQVFAIGIITGSLAFGIRIGKNSLGNVPGRTHNSNVLMVPIAGMSQTYYFK
jgi:peptide/nickel transport system substrate-binding protein